MTRVSFSHLSGSRATLIKKTGIQMHLGADANPPHSSVIHDVVQKTLKFWYRLS